MPAPLAGLRIIEIAGIGPGPFCGMMLADHGAEVIRVERPDKPGDPRDPLLRGRTTIALDLKSPEGVAEVRRLASQADGLIEGFRPGVMERLGLGPETLHADNPRLVYGRMTGWGQTGPRANDPGHDIDYVAVSGTLNALGPAGGKPVPPINLVVDAAMTEGSALLMSMMWGFRAAGRWPGSRGTNLLDGGAHFYDTYECVDGKYIAIGAIEPQFYAALRRVMALDDAEWDAQFDRARWPALKAALAERFRARSRDAWCAAFAGHEACVAPVLDFDEAPADPHNIARQAFIEIDGIVQPAPAPRYA